jgi:hypothetical protein
VGRFYGLFSDSVIIDSRQENTKSNFFDNRWAVFLDQHLGEGNAVHAGTI